jgi:excisionase family DNA binding protein
MKDVLSPKEFAQAIGVSESSIKRWVDSGTIPASKTAGGHRRIEMGEAVRFLRETKTPLLHPVILGLEDVSALGGDLPIGDDVGDTLFGFLREGKAEHARGLIQSLYLNGRSIAQIIDGPVQAAMDRLGKLWFETEQGVGIFQEHRATDIAMQSVTRIRLLIPSREGAPVAVGGAPSGDPYLLPSLAAAAVLESRGLNAVNLGPETPLESLQLAAESMNASLLWLSVTSIEDRDSLQAQLLDLVEALNDKGLPLVIGGQKADRLGLPDVPHLHVGTSMGELEALVKGLRLSAGESHSEADLQAGAA